MTTTPSKTNTKTLLYRFRQSNAVSPVLNAVHPSSKISGGISFPDPRLFHHFLTSTYKSLVDDELDKNGVWLHHLPQWGVSFPPILHLILSLAALHLASEEPSMRSEYLSQVDDHVMFGVHSVTDVLLLVDSENCQLIYMSATLICFAYFARGPRPGEFLIFSPTGQSEWLILLRGVRSILSSHRERIFTGVLTPAPDEKFGGVFQVSQGELNEHLLHIETVDQWIESQAMDESIPAVYLSALDDLMLMFRQQQSDFFRQMC
ncbi:hypothetical protein CNMCM5623_009026 [Aspergillus felis]|uniref:Transcription factor domain-containing protein n=1 Tax=Aspergillus felis TaxID=1287682 RepID=A0A8H6Q2F4_9EURO|nr:hypothetical protein CNMCM5623_009026 [Aspergillus felis]